jgi:transcriptional regulator with XRE-family HTH domain
MFLGRSNVAAARHKGDSLNVGQRIREAREDLGMQGAVLARRVGVARNHLYMIEHGSRTPSLGLLEKIARELRVEPADLLKEPALPLDEVPEDGAGPYSFGSDDPGVVLEGLHSHGIPAGREEAAALTRYLRLHGRPAGDALAVGRAEEEEEEEVDRERVILLLAYLLEIGLLEERPTALSETLRAELLAA